LSEEEDALTDVVYCRK